MATETPNYKLKKPEMNDKVDINVLNGNADIIDQELHDLEEDIKSGALGFQYTLDTSNWPEEKHSSRYLKTIARFTNNSENDGAIVSFEVRDGDASRVPVSFSIYISPKNTFLGCSAYYYGTYGTGPWCGALGVNYQTSPGESNIVEITAFYQSYKSYIVNVCFSGDVTAEWLDIDRDEWIDLASNPFISPKDHTSFYSATINSSAMPTLTKNSKLSDGIVPKGSGHNNCIWSTDATGTPAWQSANVVIDPALEPIRNDLKVLVKYINCKVDGVADWATGSDEEVGAALDRARAGEIKLQDYWSIGDVRSIHIKSFEALNTSGLIEEQDVELVLTTFEDTYNCGSKVQFDFKNSLNAVVRMTDRTAPGLAVGGYAESQMYKYNLPNLIEALPEWLKSRLITFTVKAGTGYSSTVVDVENNKLALRSAIEIVGANSFAPKDEATGQIPYYLEIKNRIKTLGINGSVREWGTRSAPSSTDQKQRWVYVSSTGSIRTDILATDYIGLAPFGCL